MTVLIPKLKHRVKCVLHILWVTLIQRETRTDTHTHEITPMGSSLEGEKSNVQIKSPSPQLVIDGEKAVQ